MPEYLTDFSEIFRNCCTKSSESGWDDLSESVGDALYERLDDLGPIAGWPSAVRNFHVLQSLVNQVGNGGMAQAAYNIPELLPLAIQAYSELGCSNAAEFCSKAVRMLPNELKEQINKGIVDTNSIGDVFAHFNDSEFAGLNDKIPDDFWVEERLNEYAVSNREHFISLDSMA